MKLTIEVKPFTLTAQNHQHAMQQATSGNVYTHSNNGIGWINRKGNFVAFRLELYKKKTTQIRGVEGKYLRSNFRTRRHWVVSRFEFSPELLKMLGVKIVQGNRNFKLVKNGK